MDVIKALKNVKGLDDYVSITEDMLKNIANFTLKLNSSAVMDAIRVLKSIQSVEVQYFHTYNKCGAAAIIFELLLGEPALEKNSAFGKELVCVVQFWLSRVREFLIHKNEHWWKLLRNLLDFIQILYLKHRMIVEYLVMYTGECLLDLATQRKPSTEQRYQILLCFNCYSKSASRELRNVMKDKYDVYFTRLAAWLPRCGDVSVQWVALETLLRWLLPRHDERVRRDAAARWFPSTLYPHRAVQVFVDKTWLNFPSDARLFLNETNEQSDSVVSVRVEKFSVGSVSRVTARSRERWLDLNTGTRCVSMMVDLCKVLNVVSEVETCPALIVTEANTTSAQMCSGPRGTIISLQVIDPLQIFPDKVLENKNQIKVSITLNNNLQKVDKALRTIFDTKYQLLKNDDSTFISQNSNSSRNMDNISEEETRFSNPPEILRRKLLEQRAKQAAKQSPSAASTSSHPMLAEKLTNLPDFGFDKELKIHTIQNLATVPELSENTSHSSLRKSGHSGTDKQSSKNGSQNTEKGKDENDNNAISNKNDQDIIEQLAKDALQYACTNVAKNTQNQRSDVARETYFTNVNTRPRRCDKREYTVRNDTAATDDSSTAFVENTPAININTTIRNRKPIFMHIDKDPRDSDFDKITFNNEAVETFFSEHVAHDRNGNVIVSPILAKKLTHWNPDSQSAAFILRPPQTEASLNFNYQEVEDCLNFVVNYVCENLHKNLNQNSNQSNSLNISETEAGPRNILLEKTTNSMEKDKKISNSNTKAINKISPVKLRYKTIEKQTKTIKKNNKVDLNSRVKKIPIIEKERERRNLDKTTTADYLETALSKRKRKLYSTKDDNLINKRTGVHVSETEDDNSTLISCKPADKSLVSNATPYKEIEKMRKKAEMQLRNRGSKVVSPKTEIANNLFDQLKKTTENNEKITFIEKDAVYDYINSSEDDEDFRKTIDSSENKSKKLKLVRRDLNKPEKSASKEDTNRNTQINKRTRSKQQIIKKHVTTAPMRELIDERMREATTEVLNTSLINESHTEEIHTELQPAHKIPRMEIIPDDKECEIVTAPVMKKTKRQTKNTAKRAKRGKKTAKNKLVITDKADDDNKTISPLPGLEIEIQRVKEPDESIGKLDQLNNKSEGDLVTLDLTQNLLSEFERVDNSPPRLNVTDELIKPITRPANNFAVMDAERVRSSTSPSVSKAPPQKQLVVVLERMDVQSLKSISTVGECPITAHGENDEPPPHIKEIDRTISPRGLTTEEFNSEDVIDFYNRLAKDYNVSPNDRNSKASEHPEKCNSAPDSSSNKTADAKSLKCSSVRVRRLTQIEIDSCLSRSRNLVSGSASTSRKSERSIRSSHKQPENDKPKKVRKSIISPIDLVILNKESTSCHEERPSVVNCEQDKPQRDSNRHDLRKGKKKILSLEDSDKKEGDEGNTSAVKRRKLEKKEHTTGSHETLPSVSSVHDWLCRNENRQQSSGEEVTVEILSSILEKLDTTFSENRQHVRSSFYARHCPQSTASSVGRLAKKLARLRSRLASEAEKHRQLIEQTVMDLQRTIKEQNESLFEKFESEIEVEFRDWARRDRDPVAFLRADVQAAINRLINKD